MSFRISALTDVGISKSINQDSFTVKRAETCIGEVAFAVVCDGMGGASYGEISSATVVNMFSQWFTDSFARFGKDEINKANIEFYWRNIIDRANEKLKKFAVSQNTAIGTTATILLITSKEFYCINVGDSRLYFLNEKISRITKDQSYVQREIELGNISETEAIIHPRRNVLLQSIGCSNDIKPDFYCGNYYGEGAFLLCSDGLRHMLTEDEIFKIINSHINDLNNALSNLIEENKHRGETDNITAVLINSKCEEQ